MRISAKNGISLSRLWGLHHAATSSWGVVLEKLYREAKEHRDCTWPGLKLHDVGHALVLECPDHGFCYTIGMTP